MDTKSISIDPQLFAMSNKKSRSRKNASSQKNHNIPIKNTDIYNLITTRLKNRKKQEPITPNQNHLKQSQDPIINIKNDIEYVQNMLDEAKHKKSSMHNKTKKSFSYTVDNEVPWGNMKNGQKQCFREWKRTSSLQDTQRATSPNNHKSIQFSYSPPPQIISHNPQPPPPPPQIISHNPQPPLTSSQHPPLLAIQSHNPISEQFGISNNYDKDKHITNNSISKQHIKSDLPNQNIPISINKKIKKTIHNKYKLGKSKYVKNARVGILLKTPTTRKNIVDECKKLKGEDISEIKSYLRKRGFIKEGSIAPANVIRELYCSLRTTGDVQNMNKEYTLDDLHLSDIK